MDGFGANICLCGFWFTFEVIEPSKRLRSWFWSRCSVVHFGWNFGVHVCLVVVADAAVMSTETLQQHLFIVVACVDVGLLFLVELAWPCGYIRLQMQCWV